MAYANSPVYNGIIVVVQTSNPLFGRQQFDRGRFLFVSVLICAPLLSAVEYSTRSHSVTRFPYPIRGCGSHALLRVPIFLVPILTFEDFSEFLGFRPEAMPLSLVHIVSPSEAGLLRLALQRIAISGILPLQIHEPSRSDALSYGGIRHMDLAML